jgi:hypothetical protein
MPETKLWWQSLPRRSASSWGPRDLGPASDTTGMWAGLRGSWPPPSLSSLGSLAGASPSQRLETADLNPHFNW